MPETIQLAIGWPLLLGVGGAVALVSTMTWWMTTRPLRRTQRALETCLSDFKDGELGRRISVQPNGGLGVWASGGMDRLVELYNQVGDTLRSERKRLVEREMLLESVLHQNPTAIVLMRNDGRILLANRSAERLLHNGYRLTAKHFDDLAPQWPATVRDAFEKNMESVFTVSGLTPDAGDDNESFHLSVRRFSLNGRSHTLYAIRRLTPELRRQEVAVWKRVIRTISHELNNTLAPISSLAHSAKRLRTQPDHGQQLDDVLDTIGESASRLKTFIASYAKFARLPDPQRYDTAWAPFLRELGEITPFGKLTVAPGLTGYIDAAQLQQVLINLIKNAREASSPVEDIEVRVEQLPDGHTLIRVLDRGHGMSDEQRTGALLPFYSTKREGTGIGLALCREILEAHGGSIELAPREGGGTAVSLWLPASER